MRFSTVVSEALAVRLPSVVVDRWAVDHWADALGAGVSFAEDAAGAVDALTAAVSDDAPEGESEHDPAVMASTLRGLMASAAQ